MRSHIVCIVFLLALATLAHSYDDLKQPMSLREERRRAGPRIVSNSGSRMPRFREVVSEHPRSSNGGDYETLAGSFEGAALATAALSKTFEGVGGDAAEHYTPLPLSAMRFKEKIPAHENPFGEVEEGNAEPAVMKPAVKSTAVPRFEAPEFLEVVSQLKDMAAMQAGAGNPVQMAERALQIESVDQPNFAPPPLPPPIPSHGPPVPRSMSPPPAFVDMSAKVQVAKGPALRFAPAAGAPPVALLKLQSKTREQAQQKAASSLLETEERRAVKSVPTPRAQAASTLDVLDPSMKAFAFD